ncbi:MAG: hypothetical protein WD534_12535 [Phycisphaeraceae bacterium]
MALDLTHLGLPPERLADRTVDIRPHLRSLDDEQLEAVLAALPAQAASFAQRRVQKVAAGYLEYRRQMRRSQTFHLPASARAALVVPTTVEQLRQAASAVTWLDRQSLDEYGLEVDFAEVRDLIQPWYVAHFEPIHALHRQGKLSHHQGACKIAYILGLMLERLSLAQATELEETCRALARSQSDHRDLYAPEWARELGWELDLWQQRTGIDLGVDLGCWLWRPAALTEGWKKPRLNPPVRGG